MSSECRHSTASTIFCPHCGGLIGSGHAAQIRNLVRLYTARLKTSTKRVQHCESVLSGETVACRWESEDRMKRELASNKKTAITIQQKIDALTAAAKALEFCEREHPDVI